MQATDIHATAAGAASEQAFQAWADDQRALGDLSEPSITKYRSLWGAWLSWCSARELAWDTLQSANIQEFLQGSAPRQGASRRQPINPHLMSSHTSQRYWRLLRGVYTAANKHGMTVHNPALDVPDADRPSIAFKDRFSQVLEPFLFSKLVMPKTIEAIFPAKTSANWWHARDRAIMAVLVDTGVTVTELVALRGADLVEAATGRRAATSSPQRSIFTVTDGDMLIDVMDNNSVDRSLPIGASLAPLLRSWLSWRRRLLVERSAATGALTERDKFMAMHDQLGPLFIARRARSGTAIFPSMDPTSVYHTVSQALKRVRETESMPSATYVAKGPAVVRNTVIRRWLDDFGPGEAAARAGLKDITSLRLR